MSDPYGYGNQQQGYGQQGGYGQQQQYGGNYGPPQQGGYQHGQQSSEYGGQQYGGGYGDNSRGAYDYNSAAPSQQYPQQGAYNQGPSDPNAPQAEGDRGIMGALGGGLAGGVGGHKLGHGIIGTIAGAVMGSALEDKYKEHHPNGGNPFSGFGKRDGPN